MDKQLTTPSRSRFLRAGAAVAAAGAFVGGAGDLASAASYAKPAGWDKLVAAANAEGNLVIYGPPSNEEYAALVTRFARAFPRIKVDGTFAYGPALISRVTAERAAGRYIPDVYINGSTGALLSLKPANALAPLEPLLVLPEILDPSLWFQNELWWTDANKPYTNTVFEGVMIPPAYYNTNMAKASDFNSYWDLTDNKWRGKIVSNDIRISGPGGVPARFIYKKVGLGRPWFYSFFNGLNIPLATDQRQLVDWLAQGRYAIAGFCDTDVTQLAINQGLPIAPVSIDHLKEGGAVAPGAGTVSVFNHAPHPNAAKLYVNWLLSREGQTAWQEETKTSSLRTDVPKNGLYLAPTARRGVTYANGGSEAYSILTATVFASLIKGRS